MPEHTFLRACVVGLLFLLLAQGVEIARAGTLTATESSGAKSRASGLSVAVSAPPAIRRAVCDVFGPRCEKALAVAKCETGGTWNPRAVGNAGELGLFQIHPIHFSWAKPWLLFVPRYNARAAYRLSRGGRDWSAWACG